MRNRDSKRSRVSLAQSHLRRKNKENKTMQIEKESHVVGIMNGGGYPRGWKLMDEEGPSGQGQAPAFDMERARLLHQHQLGENQCTSVLVKHINAPLDVVWSLVRRFDEPQKYKPFVRRCIMREGGLEVGSVREIEVTSGLPATTSIEQLERLDDNEHILGIRKLGGNHRLKNYSSVITLHHDGIDGRPGTTVVESFVVDVPDGNTDDETCCFVEHLIKSNLRSLAKVSEQPVNPQQHQS